MTTSLLRFPGLELGTGIDHLMPSAVLELVRQNEQRALPAIAKDPTLSQSLMSLAGKLASTHTLRLANNLTALREIPDNSVQLAVTSPPYWTLKHYSAGQDQMGNINDYEAFLTTLNNVWEQIFRVLTPGGRLVVVVGDVCLSRREYGRHVVFPLHASIQEGCRKLGFDNLAPIIWHKIANAATESSRNSNFLGKPYEPNGIVKNDIEYILFQRKPGSYRKVDITRRLLSIIPGSDFQEWYQQIWSIPGASTKEHPAPYPVMLTDRLIRMFSFVGDTILDPFMGSGTTNLSASKWGRHSIGFEIEAAYFALALRRIERAKAHSTQFGQIRQLALASD